MSSSYMNSSGSCLLPQLPPLPPPPFINPVQSNNWPPYNSFSSPFLPPPYISTATTIIPPPISHHTQSAGLLPSPHYSNGQVVSFSSQRGRGRRGNNRGKWKIQKCEPCDRVYKTEETFAEHLQSHVKCTQCDFTALPKKVKEHSQVHSLPDFLDFSSPDDIKQWREERKRNYPSVSNVAKKKKMEEQRRSRGQMIDTPLYRYVNQLIGDYDSRCRGRGRGRARGRGNYRGRWQHRQNRQPSDFSRSERSGTKSSVNGQLHFTMDNVGPSDSTDNDDHTPLIDKECTDNHTLMNSGGGSDGHTPLNDQKCANDYTHSNDKCTPGQGKGWSKRQRRNNGQNGRHMSSTNKQQSKQRHWTQLSVSKKPTLLEKLLVSSVKSEHNAILQCVRYTVKNDFFDKSLEIKN